MLALAHMGMTLGAATVLNGVMSRESTNETNSRLPTTDYGLRNLGRRIDIRVLLVGSLLPDIIDKPLGMIFLGDIFGNGRIFCHTLLFLVIISLAGIYLYRIRSKLWPLVLSFGTFMHLILDQMWLSPETFLWPVYGILFPKEGLGTVLLFPKGEVKVVGWLESLFYALHTEPGIYVPEIIGGAILVWFAATLIYQKRVYSFIRNGYLG